MSKNSLKRIQFFSSFTGFINFVVSIRIRVARNINGIPLNTVGDRDSRLAVRYLMEKIAVDFPVELKGKFYWLDEISEE